MGPYADSRLSAPRPAESRWFSVRFLRSMNEKNSCTSIAATVATVIASSTINRIPSFIIKHLTAHYRTAALLDNPPSEPFRAQPKSKVLDARRELGTNSRRDEVTARLPVFVDAGLVVHEKVVHLDGVAFHAGDFRDVGDLPASAHQALHLDHDVHGASDLVPQGAHRNIKSRHRHGDFKARQRVTRAVGMDRRHRTF